MTNEASLVIDCTRIHPEPSAIQRVRQRIKMGVAWPALLEFAIPHGVLPVVARNLNLHASDLAPQTTLIQLQRFLTRARERNERQWLALARIAAHFEAEDLRVLAFKGPALAALAYGNLSLRESHDLDLWVDPAGTEKASLILRSMGFLPVVYRGGTPHISHDPSKESTEFASADGEFVIDLQNLQPRKKYFFRPDFDEIWERRRPVTVMGKSVFTLGTEDLLLTLCVHGSKHVWRRLSWAVDVAALLALSPDLRWDELLARATQWQCRRRLLSTIALESALYGTPFPHHVETLLQQDKALRHADTVLLARMLKGDAMRPLRHDVIVFRHHYRCTDKRRDRLAFAFDELRSKLSRLPGAIRKIRRSGAR